MRKGANTIITFIYIYTKLHHRQAMDELLIYSIMLCGALPLLTKEVNSKHFLSLLFLLLNLFLNFLLSSQLLSILHILQRHKVSSRIHPGHSVNPKISKILTHHCALELKPLTQNSTFQLLFVAVEFPPSFLTIPRPHTGMLIKHPETSTVQQRSAHGNTTLNFGSQRVCLRC